MEVKSVKIIKEVLEEILRISNIYLKRQIHIIQSFDKSLIRLIVNMDTITDGIPLTEFYLCTIKLQRTQ